MNNFLKRLILKKKSVDNNKSMKIYPTFKVLKVNTMEIYVFVM